MMERGAWTPIGDDECSAVLIASVGDDQIGLNALDSVSCHYRRSEL